MTDKPIVVFDLDGVFADFTFSWRRLARQSTERAMIEHGAGAQETWSSLDPDKSKLWTMIGQSRMFWLDIPPLFTRADKFALRLLRQEDYFVRFVTSRQADKGTTREQTIQWLDRYSLLSADEHIDTQLYFDDHKHGLLKTEPWTEVVAIIDDKPAHIANMRDALLPVTCRDWPYNRVSLQHDANMNRHLIEVPRVSSIEEFIYKVLRNGEVEA